MSDVGDEAVEVANALQAACEGHDTAAVLMGIAMVLGHAAAQAERPDLPALMRLIEKAARQEFDRSLADKRAAI